jgi:hypothetical protein
MSEKVLLAFALYFEKRTKTGIDNKSSISKKLIVLIIIFVVEIRFFYCVGWILIPKIIIIRGS